MMEDANEVQDVLGRSYGTPDIDEADLEAGQSSPSFTIIYLFTHLFVVSAKPGRFFIIIILLLKLHINKR